MAAAAHRSLAKKKASCPLFWDLVQTPSLTVCAHTLIDGFLRQIGKLRCSHARAEFLRHSDNFLNCFIHAPPFHSILNLASPRLTLFVDLIVIGLALAPGWVEACLFVFERILTFIATKQINLSLQRLGRQCADAFSAAGFNRYSRSAGSSVRLAARVNASRAN
jgi:hypothetical protein